MELANSVVKYLIAIVTTVLFIRLLMPFAAHVGLVDKPSSRKQHQGNVPLVGGLAMFGAFAFSTLILGEPMFNYRSLFAAMGFLVFIGILDDIYDLSPFRKTIGQMVAAIFMTSWGGLYVSELGDLFGLGGVHLKDWAIPFTIVCVLGLINAVNMSDGLDGLAGGIVFIALALFGIAALSAGHVVQAKLIFLLAAVLLGFILLNMRFPWRPRAVVFMGDSGSMMLGFALTWFAVGLTQNSNPAISPVTAVWILSLPLLDMGSVMLRRAIKGRTPFVADREHMHHMLLRSGYSESQVVWIILSCAAILGGCGLAAWYFRVPDSVMFYGFMVLFAVYFYAQEHAWKFMKLIKRFRR